MNIYKILVLTGVLTVAANLSAQDYNRISLSYDNTRFSLNKDYREILEAIDGDSSFSTNGFGLNYIHGFSLSKNLPMFLEIGGNVNFNFYSKTEAWKPDFDYNEDYEFDLRDVKSQFQNINLQVPVNFTWRFNVVEDFTIAPYVGLNFKLNFVSKMRSYTEWEGEEVDKEDKEWTNLFSSDKDNMGSKDLTWNRFQMGWHVGVNFQYTKWNLGVQYGTDFIPAYSHKFEEDGWSTKPAINTGNLKLSVGYTF
ncbi:MAG: outer membrane beta-barrel protein [Bacteroidales bacterium]|nr:outer membrane beta-barrel protein [Bacteroidales bacterium]